MIATSTGLELLEVLGVIAGVVVPLSLLGAFIIKALIHKTVSPLKEKLDNIGSRMTHVESNYVALLEEIRKLPDAIDAKIKAREEIVTMKIDHLKEDLDKKQDK
jgi:hypothetical protein